MTAHPITQPACPCDPPALSPGPMGLDDGALLVAMMRPFSDWRSAEATAGRLLAQFGDLGAVMAAEAIELRRVPGVGEPLIELIGIVAEVAVRMAREAASRRPVIASWTALLAYVRVSMANQPREQFRALYLDRRNNLLRDEMVVDGQHNTILDNCAVYTAFSALDPLTQDKVSKLTGSVTETRTSRSGPAMMGAGRSSVSRAEIERPLLEPGEIRALPDDKQLVFVAGRRPLRTDKLLYDRREPFRSRAGETPPDQAVDIDAPPQQPHPWSGRRSLGQDVEASLPLFKEVAAAMDDKKAAARAADIYGRVAQEMAAQQAALDSLQGIGHATD